MSNGDEKHEPAGSDAEYLPTGSATLDRILAMDGKDPGGILIRENESPIVLIEGGAGTGKTILALQMASAIAKAKTAPPKPEAKRYQVLFYSLEQSVASLKSAAISFSFGEEDPFWDFGGSDSGPSDSRTEGSPLAQIGRTAAGKLAICHLSPLPIGEGEHGSAFEERFGQLQHMVKRFRATYESEHKLRPILFLDSLDALTTSTLGRREIYRLFQLFRQNRVPAIITSERHEGGDSLSNATVEAARFLSDVAIGLQRDRGQGYLQLYLEISKSRLGRQVFGRHLYKIRTKEFGDQFGKQWEHARPGIVVYQSIHSVLSRAREEKADSEKQVGQKNVQSAESEAERWRYEICDSCPKEEKKRSDIALIIGATEVDRGACFAVVGPAGTHKLALAMNLATGWLKKPDQKQHRNLLIVEFGGTGKIPFHCVAWFKERYMPGWNKLESTGTSSRKTVKWWKTHYKPKAGHEASGRSRLGHPSADVLTFQLGELTPEECFHAIDSCIHPNPGDRSEYSAVMLSNTAEMSTGFPALRNDPLFLPSLIDLFQMRGLVSVCIGVEGGGGASQSLDFALLAKADYRISLNHSPDMKFFMRQSGKHPDFSEQKVSLVIDNVLGKDYKRTPRWVSVEPIGKTLHCVADRNWQPAPPEPDPPTGNLPGSQRAQSRRELRSGSRTRRTPSR